MAEITDPALLTQLNADAAPSNAAPSGLVTDPDLLAKLNAKEPDKESEATKNLPDVGAPLIPSGPTLPGNPTVNDIANSASTGAMKGLIAGAGTPGDAANLLAKGSKVAGDYIANKLGAEKSPDLAPPILPTTSDIQSGVEAIRGKFDTPQTTAGKYAEQGAEFATNPFSYVGPGSTLAKATTAVASGLGSEAGTELTQNSTKPWVQELGPLLGAIAGGHVATGVPRVTPMIPEQRLRDIAVLDREGVPLTAGDRTGNTNLKAAESELSSGPNEAQDSAFKQAAFNRVGETIGDRPIKGRNGAVTTMMNQAGSQFDTLGARNTLNADPQLSADLTDIYKTHNNIPGLYPQETVNSVNGAIGRVQQVIQQGGIMSGPEYLTLRSSLRRGAMGATDPQRAEGLHDVTNALDQAMERSIQNNNPQDAGAFSQAFRNYRNALVLQDWAGSANMTPATLAQSAKKIYGRDQYTKGMDDFSDLSEAGRNVMKQFQDSGTTRRGSVKDLIRAIGGGVGAVVGGIAHPDPAAGAAEGSVLGLLLGEGAGSVAARPLMRRALMNPVSQSILSNQALPYRFETSPNTIALMNAIRGGQTPQIPAQSGQK
jgi:hypothetical protein